MLLNIPACDVRVFAWKAGIFTDLIGYAMFLFRKLIFCAKWTYGEKNGGYIVQIAIKMLPIFYKCYNSGKCPRLSKQ